MERPDVRCPRRGLRRIRRGTAAVDRRPPPATDIWWRKRGRCQTGEWRCPGDVRRLSSGPHKTPTPVRCRRVCKTRSIISGRPTTVSKRISCRRRPEVFSTRNFCGFPWTALRSLLLFLRYFTDGNDNNDDNLHEATYQPYRIFIRPECRNLPTEDTNSMMEPYNNQSNLLLSNDNDCCPYGSSRPYGTYVFFLFFNRVGRYSRSYCCFHIHQVVSRFNWMYNVLNDPHRQPTPRKIDTGPLITFYLIIAKKYLNLDKKKKPSTITFFFNNNK